MQGQDFSVQHLCLFLCFFQFLKGVPEITIVFPGFYCLHNPKQKPAIGVLDLIIHNPSPLPDLLILLFLLLSTRKPFFYVVPNEQKCDPAQSAAAY